MIVATQVVFALVVALVFSLAYAFFLRHEGPRSGFLALFLTIFLFALAGGLWLRPFGPLVWGGYLLSFLVFGALGSTILFLRAPRRPPHGRSETLDTLERMREGKDLERLTYLSLDLIFWILLVFLAGAILIYYFVEYIK